MRAGRDGRGKIKTEGERKKRVAKKVPSRKRDGRHWEQEEEIIKDRKGVTVKKRRYGNEEKAT